MRYKNNNKNNKGLCSEVLKLHQPTEAQHVRQFPKCLHGELFPNFPFSSCGKMPIFVQPRTI